MSLDIGLSPIHAEGQRFRDAFGRQRILRGVNLGGDSKLPYPDGGTYVPSDFSDHRDISFVGRPFPLEDADAHFERLARWGFNSLRLLTTWEAVEHAGPGIYDETYLAYLEAIARRAGDFGFHLFVDFHQDAWSRMSGGSGAPGWTFEAVGLDFTRFPSADAAIVMQAAMDFADPNPHQASYPAMIWSANYLAPANAIMWTLFWLGCVVTPGFRVEGVNVQDFLQNHYFGAMAQVARRLRDLPNVLGFDTLNEPGTGWAGVPLSQRRLPSAGNDPRPAKPGPAWSPLDGLAAAQGCPVTLPLLARSARGGELEIVGERICNPDQVRIWRAGASCPFEAAGIYTLDSGTAVARREAAFTHPGEQAISLAEDCYAPFFERAARTIRAENDGWMLFAEMDAFALAQARAFPRAMPARSVNASHWYDVGMLWSKSASPEPSETVEQRSLRYRAQIGMIDQVSELGEMPTVLGEFGLPFDLDDGLVYRQWANGERACAMWTEHELALSAMYDAIDASLVGSMQWNYSATNRNDGWVGDGWNQEDLSIFSIDQLEAERGTDGARARRGFDRPYIIAAQGEIERMMFDIATMRFEAEIALNPSVDRPTEVHVPQWLETEMSPPITPLLEVERAETRLRVRYGGVTRRRMIIALRDGAISIRLAPGGT